MTCNTNVIQLQDVTLASMVDNGNGTHSFNPGDDNIVIFPTDKVNTASFNTITRILTLTLSSGATVIVAIPSAVAASDPTANDGLITFNISGVDYEIPDGFTTVTGPDINDEYTVTMPDTTTLNFAKAVFRKVLPPATSTSTGVLNDVAFDADYFYICVGANTWRRMALSTW